MTTRTPRGEDSGNPSPVDPRLSVYAITRNGATIHAAMTGERAGVHVAAGRLVEVIA